MSTATTAATTTEARTWWRDAVVYQLYIRSFADGTGDGLGDIAGIRAKLGYLHGLGVDALWINPWYPSPMADAGYDVADYRAVEPAFGTAEDAAALVEEAHALGLRVILDIVPNHTSDEHEWFRAALAAGPGSPERQRYVFRPGRVGPDGTQAPPNDWRSVFGGPAWEQTPDGEWYLHLFDVKQPDLNWEHPEVRTEFESILRFWFDRGVDGFRIDVAHSLVKDQELPDVGPDRQMDTIGDGGHPFWDLDGVHEVYRGWRRVAESYADPKIFVAEAWVATPERLSRYLRPDELHTAFNFDYLGAPWDADALRKVIDNSLATMGGVGAPATWVLSNHDVVRHVSRLGRPPATGHALGDLAPVEELDIALGRRRARAAALLMLALPGGAYVYQGDELGLWEVEDLPDEVLQDPTWERSGHTERGRDGCRVPIPWSGTASPFGFSPEGATAAPWLPQPAGFAAVTVEAQDGDPASMLTLYRAALALRREHPALGDGTLEWLPSEPGVLAFSRGDGFTCLVNLSASPVPLPSGSRVLLATEALLDVLPVDAAVWLTVD
ncbi:glycoside hydrolase family 13 protein [Pseudonocardia broussonetiae]|uniref:Glycoside hydrolase family 13 protein n=1 Tax=Pseudonocardia broussonetiae TaxID=2736640 RepID=A0A6M6JJI9_9PSEU|nr:glycoside hydrolase family 13 protein [Pseudonocardia broussonetiae]QJY48304.1 glycoside hydrolase family 13 protein [Pseudonocardia broussonetiae]